MSHVGADRAVTAIATEAFGVGTFANGNGAFPGVVVGDLVHDVRPVLGVGATVATMLADWNAAIDRLQAAVPTLTGGVSLDELRALPPVQPVGQVLCAGANYYSHVRQIVFTSLRNAGDQRSDEELHEFALEQARERARSGEPFLFAGIPSAVSGADDDVVLWGPAAQHDWELELAVVISERAHRVAPEDAMAYVAGYTIVNDISVRDVMNRPNFPLTDFIGSKNRPGFFPTGPMILPSRFVPDYRRLRITLEVGGEVMQDQVVDDIIYGVEALVSYASHATVLSAGDMILTGSPDGNAGHHGNRWLKPGDVMRGSITGLGIQHNRCVAPPA